MMKREPLMDEIYFAHRIQRLDENVEDQNRKLREQPEIYVKPAIFLYTNFRSRYQQVFLGYCLGEHISVLASRFAAAVDSYEVYVSRVKNGRPDLSDLDNYVVSLWLISFALIFHVDESLWQRLLACIDNEGRDALFEALVANRTPSRQKTSALLHPKIFQPLYDSIATVDEQRSALVQKYLKTWYKAFKDTYWIDTHKFPAGGGFFGYWAVEVAGVVKAFGMDDSAFREMPYYPRDLID